MVSPIITLCSILVFASFWIVNKTFNYPKKKKNFPLPSTTLQQESASPFTRHRIKEIMDSNDVNAQTKAVATPICDSTSVNQTYPDSKG